jgi:hypothetical protein
MISKLKAGKIYWVKMNPLNFGLPKFINKNLGVEHIFILDRDCKLSVHSNKSAPAITLASTTLLWEDFPLSWYNILDLKEITIKDLPLQGGRI